MATLHRISAIAITTLREAIRNRVMGVLFLFAVGVFGFSAVLGALSLHESVRVVKDIGLAAMSLFSVLIALFLGVNLLAKELERKTVFAILSKPIDRWEFVVGKYVGLVTTIAALVSGMALVLSVVIWMEGGEVGPAMARAELLIFGEVCLLTALAMVFSSFTTPYLSAMFTGALWLIGRNHPELTELVSTRVQDETFRETLSWSLRALPDFHLYYISGALLDGHTVSVHESFVGWNYMGEVGAYTLVTTAVYLMIAVSLFRRRDFV